MSTTKVPMALPRQRGGKRRRHHRHSVHFISVVIFFKIEENFLEMEEIVNKRSPVSLRMLEFTCTTMARSGLVVLGVLISLEADYQDGIDSFGKKYFDFFRRDVESKYLIRRFGRELVTNIAQQRAFEFAIKRGVVTFVKKNFRLIERLMSEATAKRLLSRRRGDKSRVSHKKRMSVPRMFTKTVTLNFGHGSAMSIR